MSDQDLVKRAVTFGQKQAKTLLERPLTRRARAARGENGIIVAEGDSWFDYPFHDVLERLEDDLGFRVESVAHRGDRIEEMAYNPKEGAALASVLQHLKDDGNIPRAILLSGGGNDMAGDQFGMLINHASSGLPPLNGDIVNGIINQRLMYAYGCVIGRINQMTRQIFPDHPVPIVIHGYGYAVPDGRGFLGGAWFLPGPWLRPGFDQKGHTDEQKNTNEIKKLIDALNEMLKKLPMYSNIQNTTYLNLRSILSNDRTNKKYQKDWHNELHPTEKGFMAVAYEFARLIKTFPMP